MGLREVFPEPEIGKIIIQQTQDKSDGPRLFYSKFPSKIQKKKVLLMDGTVSTANSVHMAIHVLLDHGIKEENIIFVCILTSPQGLQSLTETFPAVRIVTTWVDQGLDQQLFTSPGLGPFGDRYFGVDADLIETHHADISSVSTQ